MKSKERVAKIRKYRGLTQKQVAERSGLTVRAVQNYEITDRQPKGEFLNKLAKGLNVPVSAILSDEGFEHFMIKQNKKGISDVLSDNTATNQKGKRTTAMIGGGIAALTSTYSLPQAAMGRALTTSSLFGALTLALGSVLPMAIGSLIGIGGIGAVITAIEKSKHIDSTIKAIYKEISRLEGLIVLINDKMAVIRDEYEQRAVCMQQDDVDVDDYKEFIQLSHLISMYQDYQRLLIQKNKFCSLLLTEIEEHSGKKTKMLNGLLEEINSIEKHEREIVDVITKTTTGLSNME